MMSAIVAQAKNQPTRLVFSLKDSVFYLLLFALGWQHRLRFAAMLRWFILFSLSCGVPCRGLLRKSAGLPAKLRIRDGTDPHVDFVIRRRAAYLTATAR
jgi:hypothetical protein